MKNIFSLSFMMLIITLASCSSSKRFPSEVSNSAKYLNTNEEQALVYIFRISKLGALASLRVDLNNKFLANFYPNKFYLCALEAGKYLITGRGENTDDMILNIEKGKKYYIEVIPQTGWSSARCKLKLVEPDKGENSIKSCELIGMNESAQKLLNYTPIIK